MICGTVLLKYIPGRTIRNSVTEAETMSIEKDNFLLDSYCFLLRFRTKPFRLSEAVLCYFSLSVLQEHFSMCRFPLFYDSVLYEFLLHNVG
jgi:hypothetical protein